MKEGTFIFNTFLLKSVASHQVVVETSFIFLTSYELMLHLLGAVNWKSVYDISQTKTECSAYKLASVFSMEIFNVNQHAPK